MPVRKKTRKENKEEKSDNENGLSGIRKGVEVMIADQMNIEETE